MKNDGFGHSSLLPPGFATAAVGGLASGARNQTACREVHCRIVTKFVAGGLPAADGPEIG
jgi:hypothetical protein